MKRVAILQSNYVPWKGYFDLIARADEFVFYDEVQYTKNDWRNRNVIKTPNGPQWLTIPIGFSFGQLISEIELRDRGFATKHMKTLQANYGRAPFYAEVAAVLEPVYAAMPSYLSHFNRNMIEAVCGYIGIKTPLMWSTEIETPPGKTTRLVEICRSLGADIYVSGPAAKAYLDEAEFNRAGMAVEWFDYSGYPLYPQLWGGEFQNNVSIVDLLFNCGREAGRYMKHVAR